MSDAQSTPTDLTSLASDAGPSPAARLSAMAGSLIGSEILKIAAEIRVLMGQGVPEDMIAVATEQAQEVQIAYDLIKKSRNLK